MFADRGGLVRIYDKSAQAGEAARAYVEKNLPKVVAKIQGGKPGSVAVTRSSPVRSASRRSPRSG
ncbi:hypothetical protein [Streptomyces sp. FXJ1.172]|uniref:hypothetical protein n=1 Tax=Streptomyces sp. FXJ1.172 TaxID=710705 RepID=UPI001F25EE9E